MAHSDRCFLLVEDNPNDEELTLRALKKNSILNEIVIARDGVEALDYLFGTGAYSGRDIQIQPELILLELKLPKIDGLEVLRQIRSNPATALQPVVILTTSNEQKDIATSYRLGANSYIQKPVFFENFITAVGQLGLYWLVLNQPPKNSES